METPYGWTCPFCDRDTTITNEKVFKRTFDFDHGNKYGLQNGELTVEVCPNNACKEYSLSLKLFDAQQTKTTPRKIIKGKIKNSWRLIPVSSSRVIPNYVPESIITDYKEACAIREYSPKSSATLARRCLQGMIRDFWGISKSRLIDEINDLRGKVDSQTWDAIDAVRQLGNIGAHMERDINVITEIDPEEAENLIQLIEVLIKVWYIEKHEKDLRLQKVISIAKSKKNK